MSKSSNSRGGSSPASNRLYFGDNLTVLREHVKDESVDLIYLDPPFNSDANYNVLFRSPTGQSPTLKLKPSAIPGNGRRRRGTPMPTLSRPTVTSRLSSQASRSGSARMR